VIRITQHNFQILCQKKDDDALKNAARERKNINYETIFIMDHTRNNGCYEAKK
jgi:hypothetical protein